MTNDYDDDDIPYVLAGLEDPDPDQRAHTAWMIARRPTGDPRVVAAIELMLGETAAAMLEPVSVYGELRLFAAVALAAERRAAGALEPVRVRSAPAAECASLADYERLRASSLPEREFLLRAPVDWDDLIAARPPSPVVLAVAPPIADPEDDLGGLIATLELGSTEERVRTLRVLSKSPTGDARVRRAVEALLDDRTIHWLLIPYRFGELRLLAAAALAAERHAAEDPTPVRLRTTPLLSGDTISALARDAGLPETPAIDQYARLRDRGLIAERDYVIGYPAHLGWL